MASANHTSHVRLLVRKQPKSKSTATVDDTPPTRGSKQERRKLYVSRIADTALALAVIEGMLKTHEAFIKAKKAAVQDGLLPLNAVQIIGLTTAIDFLHQYADSLSPE
jgi:hypothetical protein